MKKEIEFYKLPTLVQNFLIRIHPADINVESTINLDFLHYNARWNSATNDELLAYAAWKYPKGTKYFTLGTKDIEISSGNFKLNSYNSVIDSNNLYAFYSYFEIKWAEIVPEQNEVESMGRETYENQLIEKYTIDPEFKAGDEVTFELGKSSVYKIIHINEGKAWIKHSYQNFGTLVDVSELRKPDPDKHLREIANDLMAETESYIPCDRVVFTSENVEKMLIEMGKRVKQ